MDPGIRAFISELQVIARRLRNVLNKMGGVSISRGLVTVFEVAEETGSLKALVGKMSTPHLSYRVMALELSVYDLPAPMYFVGIVGERCEKGVGPIPYWHVVDMEPPMSRYMVLFS